MDEFETINLDIKECKICKQQTGEELISCILHGTDGSSGVNNSQTSCSSGAETFAHRICLERWEAVMKSSFYPLAQPKKTWRDRLKGLISAGQTSNMQGSNIETCTPVGNLDHADDDNNWPISSLTGHSVFSESKEAYRVEDVGNNQGQWRTNKVRIRSVDVEDSDEDQVTITSEHKLIRYTRSSLLQYDLIQLKEAVEDLKLEINKVSSDLVTQLQEKDSLVLQKHTMKVTVGQLISLQSNVKTASTQNVSTNSKRTFQDTLPCT